MVFKAGATVAVAAVAVYNSVQGRAAGALSAHNGVDSLGGFGTAGGTLIGGCAVFNNRFCIVSTAGIAAAAAVGAGETFVQLIQPGVGFHIENLGRGSQHQAEHQSQAAENRNRNHNLHIFALLRKPSGRRSP